MFLSCQSASFLPIQLLFTKSSVPVLLDCFVHVSCVNQVSGGWILDGQKRWIGNSTFADVLVIFARNTETNQING